MKKILQIIGVCMLAACMLAGCKSKDTPKTSAPAQTAGIKIHHFRVYNGDALVLNATVTAVDYYKEEFCEKIVRARKKAQHD